MLKLVHALSQSCPRARSHTQEPRACGACGPSLHRRVSPGAAAVQERGAEAGRAAAPALQHLVHQRHHAPGRQVWLLDVLIVDVDLLHYKVFYLPKGVSGLQPYIKYKYIRNTKDNMHNDRDTAAHNPFLRAHPKQETGIAVLFLFW